MKNIVLFCLYLSFCCQLIYSQNTIPKEINSKEKIGWIQFNAKTDNAEFFLCDEYNIMEYYQVGTKYREGLKSLREYFSPYFSVLNTYITIDGYFTTRFIVNCNGELDRFRFYFIDINFNQRNISLKLKNETLKALKKMKHWIPGEYGGVKYDSYAYITFKIINNEIVDVLP